MAWFDRNNAKTDSRLQNLSEQDLIKLLDEGDGTRTQLEAVRAELEQRKTTEGNLQNELQETKARLAALEANRPQQPQQPNSPQQPQRTDFLEDGDRAFYERAAPIADFALSNAAQTAKLSFKQHLSENPKDRKVYIKYQKEVDDLVERETPANKARPESWLAALTFVRGQHADEIYASGKDFFAESDASSSSTPNTPNQQDETPSVMDEKMAKRYGVDPKEIVTVRKGFTYEAPAPKIPV